MEEELEDDGEIDTAEQHKNSKKERGWALQPYQFKPGQSGNPSGRPKGPSMKEWAKNYLASLPEEERMEYLTGMRKVDVWKMAEGNWQSEVEVSGELTSKIISVDE